MIEWKPIEKAPQGKTLLIGFKNQLGKWRTTRGCYFDQEYIDENWECDSLEGWYETPVEGEECYRVEPTHWMPLPQPPEQEQPCVTDSN